MRDQAECLRDMVKQKNRGIPSRNPNKEIKIYTVASGKGGVGKTNIVVNMAISLQKKGLQVMILDADLGLANVDVVLGIYPKVTLYDVMFGNKRLKDAVVRGPGGIRIIPGGSGMIEMTKLDRNAQKKLMDQFAGIEGIDVLLIDTGAGISMNQLSFITFAQEVILVTTPEPTAITDVYSVIKIISELKIKRKIKLIVNKASSDKMGRLTYTKLKKTAKSFLNVELEYLGHVADDARVGNSVMKQVPFISNYPNCLASQCVDRIAEEIAGVSTSGVKIKTMSEVYNRLIKVFG